MCFVKVHITFAITCVVEGFYPTNSASFTITSFQNFNQALPLITLSISLIASSFGMTKFFLQGPISILPKNSPINGLISLPFIAMLCLNCMFGFRVACIENAFFTSYRQQKYHIEFEEYGDNAGRLALTETIDPIIPPDYRLIAYFVPCILSFVTNIIRLVSTGANFKQHIIRYPQVLIACCFTPFLFEGSKENKSIKIWKFGSVVNAIYIGCCPQIVLIVMDFYKGIIHWDFIGPIILSPEHIYENNDALFKRNYGNTFFALVSGIGFFVLIMFTFFTDRIFKNKGMYCKCCNILCLPCPQNCFHLNNTLNPLESLAPQAEIENDSELQNENSGEISRDGEDEMTKIYIYSNGNTRWLSGKPRPTEKLQLKQVKIYYELWRLLVLLPTYFRCMFSFIWMNYAVYLILYFNGSF